MFIAICSECGWEHPPNYDRSVCKKCGARLPFIRCTVCYEVKPSTEFALHRTTCKACRLVYRNKNWKQHLEKLDKQFDDWIAKVCSVPKDYPSLTEEQWLEACNHFNGCARCNNPEIDTRGFFVGAKLGGRYCDWNVIPLCERCANTWNLDKSAFKYIEKRAYNAKNLNYKENMKAIIKYLGEKLDNAVNRTKIKDSTDSNNKADS